MGMEIPKWIQDGGLVEVSLGGIGSIKDRAMFE
jgi:hypothetical protein